MKSLFRFVVCLILLFFVFPFFSFAADLKLGLSKSDVVVGELFSARIVVATPDQAANAVSGVLSFNPSKLQIVSLSKGGSVINLWVTEPDFSNAKGQVNFEGAILNPGFIGSAGTVLTINFKAKEAGTANLSFVTGSVLANDGAGTSIVNKLGQAVVSVKNLVKAPEPVVLEEEPSTPVIESTPIKKVTAVPPAPVIISPTHYDQTKWYNNSLPKFSWNLSDDITGVSFLFGADKGANPGTKSDGLFDDHVIDNKVPDGTWYFSLRLKNGQGWGPVSRFVIHVDTLPPSRLDIEEKPLGELNYKTSFVYDASDELSGLSYYEFIVDDLTPEIVQADKAHLYETPALSSGHHTLTVRAVDQAGNKLEKKINFNIVSPLTQGSLYRLGDNLVVILSVLVPLLLLVLALLYIVVVGWRKVTSLKRNLRREVDEVEEHLHEAFDFIRDDLREQLKLIEKTKGKRKLTLLEAKIMRKLRVNLNETEKFIKKDIQDITNKIT